MQVAVSVVSVLVSNVYALKLLVLFRLLQVNNYMKAPLASMAARWLILGQHQQELPMSALLLLAVVAVVTTDGQFAVVAVVA
jgi:hypothetical protein